METSRSRAALEAWLAQVEEVLGEGEGPSTHQEQDEDEFPHGDAA